MCSYLFRNVSDLERISQEVFFNIHFQVCSLSSHCKIDWLRWGCKVLIAAFSIISFITSSTLDSLCISRSNLRLWYPSANFVATPLYHSPTSGGLESAFCCDTPLPQSYARWSRVCLLLRHPFTTALRQVVSSLPFVATPLYHSPTPGGLESAFCCDIPLPQPYVRWSRVCLLLRHPFTTALRQVVSSLPFVAAFLYHSPTPGGLESAFCCDIPLPQPYVRWSRVCLLLRHPFTTALRQVVSSLPFVATFLYLSPTPGGLGSAFCCGIPLLQPHARWSLICFLLRYSFTTALPKVVEGLLLLRHPFTTVLRQVVSSLTFVAAFFTTVIRRKMVLGLLLLRHSFTTVLRQVISDLPFVATSLYHSPTSGGLGFAFLLRHSFTSVLRKVILGLPFCSIPLLQSYAKWSLVCLLLRLSFTTVLRQVVLELPFVAIFLYHSQTLLVCL